MNSSLLSKVNSSFMLNGVSWSTPAYAKVNNAEILVTADISGVVSSFDINSGEKLWDVSLNARVTASPTLVDVNQDSLDEVIIGAEDGYLYCLNITNGNVLWRQKCGSSIRATAAIADVNGDGRLEVLISGYGTRMYCLSANRGEILWVSYLPKHEFYRSSKIGAVSSPLIADVDLDGNYEIVVGIRSSRLYCLDARNGSIKWFCPLRYDPDSSPSFAVVGGKPLVFFGGGEHTGGDGDNAIICLNGNNGSIAWRTIVNGGLDSSPVLTELNNDGELCVIICSLADASCYALNAQSGKILWRYQFGPTDVCEHDENNICRLISKRYFTEDAVCRSYSTALILKNTDDGHKLVCVGSNNGEFVILDGKSGEELFVFYAGGMVRGSSIFIPKTNSHDSYIAAVIGDKLALFDCPGYHADWRMFKGEPTHLGQTDQCLRHELIQNLPAQKFTWMRLIWHWLVVDFFRYTIFQLEHKVLSKFGIKLFNYYY